MKLKIILFITLSICLDSTAQELPNNASLSQVVEYIISNPDLLSKHDSNYGKLELTDDVVDPSFGIEIELGAFIHETKKETSFTFFINSLQEVNLYDDILEFKADNTQLSSRLGQNSWTTEGGSELRMLITNEKVKNTFYKLLKRIEYLNLNFINTESWVSWNNSSKFLNNNNNLFDELSGNYKFYDIKTDKISGYYYLIYEYRHQGDIISIRIPWSKMSLVTRGLTGIGIKAINIKKYKNGNLLGVLKRDTYILFLKSPEFALRYVSAMRNYAYEHREWFWRNKKGEKIISTKFNRN